MNEANCRWGRKHDRPHHARVDAAFVDEISAKKGDSRAMSISVRGFATKRPPAAITIYAYVCMSECGGRKEKVFKYGYNCSEEQLFNKLNLFSSHRSL